MTAVGMRVSSGGVIPPPPRPFRFARWQFWFLVGLFAVDVATPFVPLVSAALLGLAVFSPHTLTNFADRVLRPVAEP